MMVSDKVKKENSSLDSCEVVASRYTTDTISLQQRESLTELKASKKAISKSNSFANALQSALAALALESFGVAKEGKASQLAKEGQLSFDGDIPFNTFGGLKARGHPVGATGVYQVVENYLQLTNQAGKNQVPGIEYALSQNIGGSGATISVNICKRS